MGKIGVETAISVDRAAIAAQYAAKMAPMAAKQLKEARSELVRAYRAGRGGWADGIDTPYDRWYRAEEWTDAGEFIGSGTKLSETKLPEDSVGGENERFETKRSVGRPKSVGEPWVGLGISKSDWYRRKKDGTL